MTAKLNAKSSSKVQRRKIELKNISFGRAASNDSLGGLQKLQFFLMEESCLELVLQEDLCLYWSSAQSDTWPGRTAPGSACQSVSCQPVPCREERCFHSKLTKVSPTIPTFGKLLQCFFFFCHKTKLCKLIVNKNLWYKDQNFQNGIH